ncbi:MAG: translocation/assembly module TamB domain-containing protein [Bacteroidetes bacterium]|nr:translocation/assembly module TamB domain-containing protein [Bacteroidota bacterium]
MAIVLLLGTGFFYLSSTESGQKWLTKKLTNLGNKYLFERVEIGLVKLEWPLKLHISNLVVYDHKDSVLLSAQTLKTELRGKPLLDSNLIIKEAVLSNFHVNLAKYKGDEKFNYMYALKSQSKSDAESPIKSFLVETIILDEGDFQYHYYDREPIANKQQIDYNHLVVRDINSRIDSLYQDSALHFDVAFLKCQERSGFKLNKLTTKVDLADSYFNFNEVAISTPNGTLAELDYQQSFENWDTYSDYVDQVSINAPLRKATVQFKDLQYFSSGLEMFKNGAEVSGSMKGTISGFWVNDLQLDLKNGEYLTGDMRMSNAAEGADEIFMDLKISQSKLSARAIDHLFTDVKLPSQIYDLGVVSGNGQFTGAFSDFVSYAHFNTAMGKVDSDLRLHLDSVDANSSYSGNLDLHHFNLGQLLNEPLIGKVDLTSELNGKGLTLESVDNVLKANVAYIDLNGYRYTNMAIDGVTKNRFFNGELIANDPNLELTFKGKVDMQLDKPKFNFNTSIAQANLYALNLVKDTVQLTGDFVIEASASNVENVVGSFKAQKAHLKFNDKTYNLSQASLTAVMKDSVKHWNLKSDLVSGYLQTTTLLQELPDLLLREASQLVNQQKFKSEYDNEPAFVKYAFTVYNLEPVLRLWRNDVEIENGTKIKGLINSPKQLFEFDLSSDKLVYGDLKFHQNVVSIFKNADTLYGHAEMKELEAEADSLVHRINLDFHNDSNQLVLNQKASVLNDFADVNLNLRLDIEAKDSNAIVIDSSLIQLKGSKYYLSGKNNAWIGTDSFTFNNLSLFDATQHIYVNGGASINGHYALRTDINDMKLSHFKGYLGSYFESLSGLIKGNIYAHNESGFAVFEADLSVDSIDFKEMNLDHAILKSTYDDGGQLLSFYSELKGKDSTLILNAFGGIRYDESKDLTAKVELNKVPISMFDTLLSGVMHNIEGTVTGEARISGKTTDPKINGFVQLDTAALTVDYLNTRYKINHKFPFNSEKIEIKNALIEDVDGHFSTLNGFVDHKAFSAFNLNVDLVSDQFQVLNTTADFDELYYGTAYVTGNSKFTGPLLSTKMQLDLKTEPGTKLFLPIEDDEGYAQQSFIHFVTHNEEKKEQELESEDDFSMDMKIQVTDVAEVQLIFDEQLGDVIKATGNGNLNLILTPGGDFEMYGDYIIEQGNYLFTAFDLINKRFKVKQGSRISWVGDPIDALIDISAYYELKANATMLLTALDKVDNSFNAPVPVQARASLKGSLLKPEIKLSFDIIDDGSSAVGLLRRELDQLNLSQDEIDKQVVSLLVLNRFMPVYTGGTGNVGNAFGSGYEASLGDFVSNQLTNWLSSLDDDLSVNFTYSTESETFAGNERIVLSQNEIELALSYSFFNDRVQVNYAYEFANNYRPNTEVSYKANKDGSLRFKIFNRQSQNPLIAQDTKTYGIGVFFRREFNSVKELFKKKDKLDSE